MIRRSLAETHDLERSRDGAIGLELRSFEIVTFAARPLRR
jgi:hypothetical protein